MKLRKILTLLIISILLVSLSSCSKDNQKNHEEHSSSETTNSNSEFKEITGDELQKLQDTNSDSESYLLVDTRSSDDYRKGHLKYALNIPFKEFKNNISKLDYYKDKKIIFYCHKRTMSIDAAKMLFEVGFNKENLVVAPGVKEYSDYKFVNYINYLGEDFQQVIVENSGLILDVRKEDDYNKGHINNAKNIDVNNLDSISDVLPSDKNTYIYVYSNNKNNAVLVSQKLIDLGYVNVVNSLSGTDYYNFEF